MSKNRKHSTSKSSLMDIVITTAGRFDELEKCLNAVYREAQQHPVSIYIVDDFSPAEERIANQQLFEYQADKDPAHNIISFRAKRHTQSEGFPKTANDGGRDGKSPLIMFLSDDVELQDGALDKIIRRFDDVTIGIVGIKLLFPPTSTSPIRPAGMVQHVGMALNIRGEPIHPLVGWHPDNPKCGISREVWGVTGACFSIRRNLYNKVGGFNQIYGKGTFEDMEMCMAVRQLGQKIFVECEAVGYHYTGGTAEKNQFSYPLQSNLMTFRSRWQNTPLMNWTEAEFW